MCLAYWTAQTIRLLKYWEEIALKSDNGFLLTKFKVFWWYYFLQVGNDWWKRYEENAAFEVRYS